MERITSVQTIKHADGNSHEQMYCFGHLWGPAFFKNGTKDYEEYLLIVKRLAEYEGLEERLQNIYGEHHGLLNEVVASLERHEKIDLPQPVIKSRLLTDEDVDQWDKWNTLKKQGKLPELPCAVGDTVYEVQDLRKRIQPYTVIAVHISNCGIFYVWELKDGKGIYSNVNNLNGFSEYALGKSVFLTYEEAEAALKELEGKEE